ncbi:hypothetical protein [Mesorhizobium dulcispinae]|uniref:hypothetical protein n=1 Tax=Mesorhizobium dulcispinae TaxID=3072316 RepID=UPI002A2496FB|nr:hypothetical protein [Mesorhizobium sp. VK23D]MDX8520734.1 hypothetical protein [Mesorhizobium sp. VK23D]
MANRFRQALPLQRIEVFGRASGRVPQPRATSLNRDQYDSIVDAELLENEIVGVDQVQMVFIENGLGKIPEVEVTIASAAETMAAARTWRSFSSGSARLGSKVLIAINQAIRDGAVHQVACSVNLLRLEIRTVLQEVAHPLIMDLFCPLGAIEATSGGKFHEEIAQRGWIKNASVQDSGTGRGLNSPSPVPGLERPVLP